MKKLLLLIAVVAFVGFSAQAQSVNFGVRAGMTASNIHVKVPGASIKMDTKIGFYAGAMAEIGVSENFAVQPEAYFEALGAKQSSGDEELGQGNLNLGYVSVPVLLKYKNQGFSAFVGPQIGLLLSAKAKANGESADVKDEFKSSDFAGIIGVGYTLESGLGFDGRYQLGLSNIAKESGEGTVKNNAFTIGIHYFFNK